MQPGAMGALLGLAVGEVGDALGETDGDALGAAVGDVDGDAVSIVQEVIERSMTLTSHVSPKSFVSTGSPFSSKISRIALDIRHKQLFESVSADTPQYRL